MAPSSASKGFNGMYGRGFSEVDTGLSAEDHTCAAPFATPLLEDPFADHQPLDLVGPFVDLAEFGITHHFLYQVVIRITFATHYLNGVRCHFHGHIRCQQFGHG